MPVPSPARTARALRYAGAPRPGLLPPTKTERSNQPGLSLYPDEKWGVTSHRIGHAAPKYPPNLDTATLRAQLSTRASRTAIENTHCRCQVIGIRAGGVTGRERQLPRYDIAIEMEHCTPTTAASTSKTLRDYWIACSSSITLLNVVGFAELSLSTCKPSSQSGRCLVYTNKTNCYRY